MPLHKFEGTLKATAQLGKSDNCSSVLKHMLQHILE